MTPFDSNQLWMTRGYIADLTTNLAVEQSDTTSIAVSIVALTAAIDNLETALAALDVRVTALEPP